MRKPLRVLIPATLLLAVAAHGTAAQDGPSPIKWPRQPSLSPDGRTIAFSYQGDIWTVPAEGGTATRVTLHEAHDQLPVWSPDGRQIAFSSNREGGYDVWVMPAIGGRPRRMTYHSAPDSAQDWSPDGKEILFSSSRETTRNNSLWAVNTATGASRLVVRDDVPLNHAAFTPDGRQVLATRGGSWTRKHYRGSANSDLLAIPAAGGAPSLLVKSPENERWPRVTPDGRTVFYVCDRGGPANIWKQSYPSGRPVQVTKHGDEGVYYPSLARNGSRMVYEHNWKLWTLDPKTGSSAEVRILAPSDDRSNTVRRENFTTGIQEALLSPNGRQIAFVVRGEVFVQPATGGEATRLTETPQREEDIAWSPDSSSLAFISDRDGVSADLFVMEVRTKATRRVTNTPAIAEQGPAFSPDGKSLAWVRGYNGTELVVAPVEGGEPRVIASVPQISGAAWSPDSKWLAYSRSKAHSAGSVSDIYVAPAAGGKEVNVTRYPGINANPIWTQDGRRIVFRSNRATQFNLYAVNLRDERAEPEQPDPADAAAGATPPAPQTTPRASTEVRIDFDDIHERARQLTRAESGVASFGVAPDSRSVVFAMSQLGRPDIWRIGIEGGTPTRITQTGTESGQRLQLSADGNRAIYLSGGIKSLALNTPAPAPTSVAASARMDVDVRAEMLQMFDEAWRKTRDSFYDEKMHGVDWDRIRAGYRPVVEDITYREDFSVLFNLALGELNASHTGLTTSSSVPAGPSTASLGVDFDYAHAGPGVKVASVMPKGPADRAASRLNPGDVILKIDGRAVENTEKLYDLLTEKTGRRVELLVSAKGQEAGARTVRLRPITTAAYSNLEYDRWTKEREKQVEQASAGRLGYIHLDAMGASQLERFRRLAYGDMQEKDGVILDLRFNGGGNIADEIFSILNNKVFSYRTMRGDPKKLTAPLPAFDKPVIVLINEASFSNAEVFPWGFKELKLGKVVGVPTYGAVIGTGATDLIDGSTLRVPAVGSYTLDGKNMENNGTPPDILVEHSPEDIHARQDRQLDAAIKELLRQVGNRSSR